MQPPAPVLGPPASPKPLLVVHMPSVGRYPADKARLRAAVMDFMAGHGFELVPEREVERVVGRALRGQRQATGEACGAPAPAAEALARAFPSARSAYTFIEDQRL